MTPSEQAARYDVLVIGAGCVGSGTARDLAKRGLRTALMDMRGPGAGTTGASSGMIHGGARYLLSDVETTQHSSEDAGHIARIAPFMIFRIPFLYTLHPGEKPHPALLEAFFSAYDSFAHLRGGHRHTRLDAAEARRLEPALSHAVAGGFTFDEWGIDAFRLCVLNALDARRHGADLLYGRRVESFVVEGRTVTGVRARNQETGELETVTARMTVNAAGPWAALLLARAGVHSVKLRWGKGSHLVLERRVSNVGIITNAIDGRAIFLYPHEQNTWIGTTDDDYYGDPDRVLATRDEAEYLLQGVERTVPGVRDGRVVGTLSGLRPTLHAWGPYEDDLSRRHVVVDHLRADGMQGLLTVVGGKLASYRLMAQEASDAVCGVLDRPATCRTHLDPLPGGEEMPDAAALAREHSLSALAVRRLCSRHGANAVGVLEVLRTDPSLATPVCPHEPVLAAEVAYVVREEGVRTLEALRRHTRMGFGACQGGDCAPRAAALLSQLLDRSPEEALDELEAFVERRWQERRDVVCGVQLAQEELTRARLRPLLAGRKNWGKAAWRIPWTRM